MRALWRGLGVLLAAGAFVAGMADATRSIADGALRAASLGAAWGAADPGSLEAATATLAGSLGTTLAQGLLGLPLTAVLVGLAALCLWLGRRPRPRIGYAPRPGQAPRGRAPGSTWT